MVSNKYTIHQRKQILMLRDKECMDFSKICDKMQLSQREARNLYIVTKRDKRYKNLWGQDD